MTSTELHKIVDAAIQKYHGRGTTLESAIGALYVGHAYGWRVMFLMHNRTTIRGYEKTLGISFQEALPEETALSKRSPAFRAIKHVGNFWKAAKGETPGIKSTHLDKAK